MTVFYWWAAGVANKNKHAKGLGLYLEVKKQLKTFSGEETKLVASIEELKEKINLLKKEK
jgi:hypothetical protein